LYARAATASRPAQAEGLAAISRGWSEARATPPDFPKHDPHPGGMPASRRPMPSYDGPPQAAIPPGSGCLFLARHPGVARCETPGQWLASLRDAPRTHVARATKSWAR
jgi:hypothetical protein